MQLENTDCAIVGGGLAGLALSILLAEEGLQVALFEKEEYPFHRVCGEYVSLESWDFLLRLGLPLPQMQLPQIRRLEVSSPQGRVLTLPLDLGGFGISRYRLDQLLLEQAQQRGVRVLQNTEVSGIERQGRDCWWVTSPRGIMECRLAVGSFGKRSRMDFALERPHVLSRHPYVGVKYHVQAQGAAADLIQLHNFAGGYCGFSKVEDERYCLCYLADARLLRQHGSVEALEREVLSRNPHLKQLLALPRLFRKPLSVSQISFQPKTQSEQGILMLGDAAGMVAPLCGNGMSMALQSAQMLSPLALQYLQGELPHEQLEQQYSQLWRGQFSTRLRAGRMLQRLFGNEQLSETALGLLQRLPLLGRRLLPLTHGQPF